MKFLLLTSFMFLCATAFAQDDRPWRRTRPYDFTNVDAEKVDLDKVSRMSDSLFFTTGMDSLLRLSEYVEMHKPSKGYGSFVLGMEFGKHSFKTLNKTLVASGFDPLTETLSAVILGADIVEDRWLISMSMSLKVKEKIKNDDVTLSFASGGFFTFNLGYGIIDHRWVKLYPVIGLSYRKFTIDARNKGIGYDHDFAYYLTNFYQSSFRQKSLTAQAGAELDFVLTKQEHAGIILAIRGGFEHSVVEGEFRQHNHGYDFDFKNDGRKSYFSVGLKFFAR